MSSRNSPNSLSLLSIGQLCDAGCRVEFTATMVTVTFANEVVLQGVRTNSRRLWNLGLHNPVFTLTALQHTTNAAIGTTSAADLVAFAHAALFSPSWSTLEQSLQRNYIINFPGRTVERLQQVSTPIAGND